MAGHGWVYIDNLDGFVKVWRLPDAPVATMSLTLTDVWKGMMSPFMRSEHAVPDVGSKLQSMRTSLGRRVLHGNVEQARANCATSY